MKPCLIFYIPVAEAEIEWAYRWYKERNSDFADRWFRDLMNAIATLWYFARYLTFA